MCGWYCNWWRYKSTKDLFFEEANIEFALVKVNDDDGEYDIWSTGEQGTFETEDNNQQVEKTIANKECIVLSEPELG